MINNITIGDLSIDALHPKTLRDFYAALMGWKKKTAWGCPAVLSKNGLLILFMDVDCGYIPPVWPEEPGKRQKQMHLDLTVDDVAAAAENAIRLGAAKAASQYGGKICVTMLDPEGHPFCLCKRQSEEESVFVRYFKEKRGCAIPEESIRLCSHEIPSQSAQQRIWTAARKDEEFFAYRVAMPRHFFSFKKAFSTRWRKR